MIDDTRLERLLRKLDRLRPDQFRLVEQMVSALLKPGARPVVNRPGRKSARSGQAVHRG